VNGALEQQADQTYNALAPDEQQATRLLLLKLVQLGEGNEDTRRRVALDDLTPAGRDPAQTAVLVQTLANARLLTTSTAPGNSSGNKAPIVEVSHEALIRGWQRLHDWLKEDRELERLQRQIGAATKEWLAGNQDASHLWIGARLAAVEGNSTKLDERLTAEEQDFLTAGRAEQQRRAAAQRRGRIVATVAVLAVIAVLAVGSLAGVIWQQGRELEAANSRLVVANTQVADERDSAQQAQQTAVIAQETAVAAQAQVEQLQRETLSRRLAAESQAIREDTPGFALSPAIQAWRVAETFEADDAIRSWFDAETYSVESTLFHEDLVSGALWNSDKSRILTWSEDGTAKLWNTDGAPIATLTHDDQVNGASWNGDESRILTWSDDHTAKLWNTDGHLSPPSLTTIK
jgi:hypothetical protein